MKSTAVDDTLSSVTSNAGKQRRSARSNYYIIISIVALALVMSGFSFTYFVPMVTAPDFTIRPMVHTHATLYFLWMALFILQPTLVRLGRTDIHKKIGVAGFILAGAMVIVGITTAITGAKVNSPTMMVGGLKPQQFLIVPLTDMVLFVIYLGFSLANLKNLETHKRLMILATVALLPAAVGRLSGVFNITNVFVLLLLQHCIIYAGVIYDYATKKKFYKAYIWGGLLMILIHLVRFPLATSEWWTSVSEFLVR